MEAFIKACVRVISALDTYFRLAFGLELENHKFLLSELHIP